jgi:hypothetical protein
VIFKVNQSVFKLFVLCSRLLDLSLSLCGFFFFFKKKEMILDKNKGHLGESGDKRNGDRLAG